MDLGIKDKVAIITGSALGVGRAIANTLAADECQVVVADINADGAKKAADDINSSGGRTVAFQVDVTKSEDVNRMIKAVLEQFGRIDILVNNAGIVGQQGPWMLLKEENFDQVITVNFKGMFLCAKAVIPHMIKQKNGRIINISSCAGKTGEENNGVYSATKAAVCNMTQSLADELGQYGINVNAVCPAAMDTCLMEKVYWERAEYFGLKPEELKKRIKSSFRLPGVLTVDDAAKVVLFLASDLSEKMTGQAINITAGIEKH